jgi:hypothetical protein
MGKHVVLKARIAGLLYVILIAAGLFAEVFVRGQLFVSNDAAATAANLRAGEQLFRLGLVADIICDLGYIGVVAILYELMRAVDRGLSFTAASFGLVGTAVFGANLVAFFSAFLFAQHGPALAALPSAETDALALAFLKLHATGYQIAMVFFGCHLMLVGGLIIGSTYLPRLLGVLWALGGVFYLGLFLANFVAPSIVDVRIATRVGGAAEIALALWLLVFGVNATKWRTQAEASAQ